MGLSMQKFALWVSLIFLTATIQAFAWDESRLETYFEENQIYYLEQLRFFTYLYAAQSDAATCSSEVRDLIAESLKVRMFPNSRDFSEKQADFNAVIQAENILCPYLARLSLENSSSRSYKLCFWLKQLPYAVSQVAKWLPWVSPLPQPPPPLAATDQKGWLSQFAQLKKIRMNLTEKEKEIMRAWAYHHGKNYEWRVMANNYMQEHQIPLDKVLLVRSILMKGIYTGVIAEMNAKYTYCVPRPFMMDPAFKPLIHRLETPSYPSGHAIQGAIFATILSHFFPEDCTYWQHLDEEGSNTRLWAGVHFPEDIEQGHLLGQKIADQLLKECSAPLELGK
jgi:hypothetical protein